MFRNILYTSLRTLPFLIQFVIIVSLQGDALLSLYHFKVMLYYHCIIAGGCFVIIVSLQGDALLSLYHFKVMLCYHCIVSR